MEVKQGSFRSRRGDWRTVTVKECRNGAYTAIKTVDSLPEIFARGFESGKKNFHKNSHSGVGRCFDKGGRYKKEAGRVGTEREARGGELFPNGSWSVS